MQCTGGTADRDLFVDPYDTSTMTDYKFDKLIENCRGILSLGAKPMDDWTIYRMTGETLIKFAE